MIQQHTMNHFVPPLMPYKKIDYTNEVRGGEKRTWGKEQPKKKKRGRKEWKRTEEESYEYAN